MSRFIHLHTHSHYSLLSALPKVPDLVKAAKADGAHTLALTDNGNLYGAIEFYKECKSADIKPIIGIDAYIAPRTRTDKQAGIDSRRTRLILLAKNEQGYKNLMQLVTLGYLEGFYYKPRIDRELLEKYHEGLIAIASAFTGPLTLALQGNDIEKASEIALDYKNIFGEDFYLEITHHPDIDDHPTLMDRTKEVSKNTGVPLVAGGNVYYIHPSDKQAQQTLMLVNSNRDLSDVGNDDDTADFSFISDAQAQEYFRDVPSAIENTEKIAEKCILELELGKWAFPDFKLPPGDTPDEAFRKIVYEGFVRRNVEKTDEVIKRVEYELEVIKGKGYSPYFLIVADLLAYARTHGILSNIRGSVSGSMVTYLSGITNIDPIEYEIPFERFLNPDRPSAPDIDMDFADNRRDEMVEYARTKYGSDKVAQIGTFGTMAARGAVRDVTRALGYEVSTGDKIAKMIPMGSQGFPMTIDHALEIVPDLKKLYESDTDVHRIIDMAKKIEGCARHISVHAAGIVISPTALTDFTPLQYDTKGENKIITQYDMYSIDENGAGLLKFDFLGLKNLSILKESMRFVKKIYGVEIDIDTLPIDDTKTFEMLARGETGGLFQLNGDGMTKYLKDLRPTSIHDINAMVALYRPGPIQFIPQYIERKHNPSLISYLDSALEPILKKTYGILVYQDDLLMMAHKLAGYSWGEVDKFRKAVGKKIPEEMAAQKEKFIKGCVEKSGWPEKKAKEIWSWIEPFAAYGFNKAHSVSYGRVAYQTAYFKANFPAVYMANVLTSESGNVEKIAETVADCKRMGIPVLPPSVNESFEDFSVVPNTSRTPGDGEKIRFGLNTIKNFGESVATSIIEERKANGLFESLSDFLTRVKDKNLNKKSLESLVKAGALDDFADRGAMYGNLEMLLEYNKEKQKQGGNQDSLFGGIAGADELNLSTVAPITQEERLLWEKELLGLYISGHPLEKYRAKLEARPINIALIKAKAQKEREEGNIPAEDIVVIGGIVEDIRVIMTKKNDEMAFVRIADLTGSIEVVVFPRTYARWKGILKPDTCVAMKAKVSDRNNETSLLAESFMALQ
ncbi:MAG: DNA polymerase III subunit alpha [Candidatus Taylorbacteria bacterium CG10_big_fil_rev_8_21_14_0_10_41_48]|uniref:DNA polymerase III subunit alpha n=1 Tax=Candidatus Taylorbacteria bacterium CG10_big_fil_rev_8_21_14_0_10_41_48 TaxID=1975024 RepID=A0A2M8LCA2_9BACT|nr:MAG: DNA polymerase III subunit alpha [Candidatus Taylorbacteria bacterium CG10_big_fil_rev_8_21_14_0_10_41_48]